MGRPPGAALVAALLLVAPAALSPPALALAAPSEEPALLLVGFVPGAAAPLDPLRALGATVVRVDERLDFAVVVAAAPSAFEALAGEVPGVAYVERDGPMHLLSEAGDDELQDQQWGLAAVRAPQAWDLLPAQPDDSVTIAVLDTGSDWNHHDLAAQLWNENGRYGDDLTLYASAATCALQGLRAPSCFYVQRDPEEVLGPMDFHGHGTHVAGIAAADRDGLGVAGVADATVHTYKVLPTGQSFFALVDVVASGIALAAADGNAILSLSLGCFCDSPTLNRAVDFAWEKGSLVVAAAGNSDSTTPVYPAAHPKALSVAAVDERLQRWILEPGVGSSYGPTVDLAAPGANVLSDRARWTANFGFYEVGLGYKTMSGTSMATPHVAGVAALVLQAWPEATNAQVRDILERSARDLGAPGYDVEYGHGLVDAEAAVRLALAAAGPA